MGERHLIAVVGLADLGHVLEDGKPEEADVVTVAGGPDVSRRLAQAVRGATRDTLLCVVADTGDAVVNRLPARLARGGLRVLALTGLDGATATFPPHHNLATLAAPFTADDVLACLSTLPGDVPFFLPIEGGDRAFGVPAVVAGPPAEPTVEDIILGGDPDDMGEPGEPNEPVADVGVDPGDGDGGQPAEMGGPPGERGGEVDLPGEPAEAYPLGAPAGEVDPLGDLVGAGELAGGPSLLPAWAQLTPLPSGPGWGPGAMTEAVPAWAAHPYTPAGPSASRPGMSYADRVLRHQPVMDGVAPPPLGAGPRVRPGQVLSVCSYKGGSGKCLAGDAIVVDPATGLPSRLDALVHDPRVTSVLTLDGGTIRAVPIAARIDSGVQPTLRVELRSGRSVTATPHHPFLLPGGWRRADEVAVGESVAVPARVPFPERPRRMDAYELDRLAMLIAGPHEASPGPGSAGAPGGRGRLGRGCVPAAGTMPQAAYRLPPDQLQRFIALVWTLHGSATDDGPPEVVLAHAAVARALQHLLLRFGVQSRVAEVGREAGGGRRSSTASTWRVVVDRAGMASLHDVLALRSAASHGAGSVAAHGAGDVVWDEVVAVTPAGEQQVWDLTVEPTHCFVADDVIVHNTTTAVLAAAALARAVGPRGKRVALVDANTAQSSISTVLRRPARGTVVDLARTDVDEHLLAAVLTPMEVEGLDILFGAPDLRLADGRLLTPALFRRIVAALRRTHDYVVVDTPVAEAVDHALFDDFVLRDSDRVLVVLDPNRETVHNNVEWLDIVGDPVSAGGRNLPAEKVGIVLNRAQDGAAWDANAVNRYFRRYQFLGAVPHRASVQQAADDGRLLDLFDGEIERAVRRVLAAVVDEPLVETDPEPPASGLDRVLARLFRR